MEASRSGRLLDHGSSTDLLAGAAAGLLAGMVASWAMNVFQTRVWSAPSTGDEEPSTVVAARKVARLVGHEALTDAQAKTGGNAVHYALGASLGATYGLGAEFNPSIARGRGLPFGIAAALLLDDTIVPAFGLANAPWRYGARVHVYAMVSHLVFGGVLELARGALRRGDLLAMLLSEDRGS